MEDTRAIAVSPRHQIRLASEYLPLLDRAPARDFVVHTIERRQANDMPLMAAEIVIASAAAREQFPLARTFPLHFRKTYFSVRLHRDPQQEFEHARRASEIAQLPPPIGAQANEFRSCFIPGRSYRRMSPFDTQDEEANIRRARDLPLISAAGLWRMLEDAYRLLTTLHAGGFSHGDAQLQNFIVSPAPLEVVLIDFEAARMRDEVESALWETRCDSDFDPVLQEALLLQAALGPQPGELAERAHRAAPRLFRDPARLLRCIRRQEELS
ncbi:MAG: Lipopolysaccharide kinase (Kdo/WaaP) family [Pseudomonadota bacterium]